MADPGSMRKYRIERYLAEGGMGAVYVGKKIGASGFEKDVVLKQLLPEFTSRPEFRDLFFREAKISGTLDHVNLVRTYDLVRSDESLFIVMEYVRGADLRTITWRTRLRRRPLSPAAILHIFMETLAGLAYAHSKRRGDNKPLGIIHRDVSPSNILCSGQGEVKLSDFGIAKATTFSSVFYRVRGKVGYMSPEQARNEPLDGRSDLFSLAVCLHEALTGERLYTGDLQTPCEVIYSQVPAPLSTKRADLPKELDAVMAKALAIDPSARFGDAQTFADALREVAHRHGIMYSAPALAAELAAVLGPNPDDWLAEKTEVGRDTERLPTGRTLEGSDADDGVPARPIEVPRVPVAHLAPHARSTSQPAIFVEDALVGGLNLTALSAAVPLPPVPPPAPPPVPTLAAAANAASVSQRSFVRLALLSAVLASALGAALAHAVTCGGEQARGFEPILPLWRPR